MLKVLKLISGCLLLSATLVAQTRPAAEGRRPSLWVGGEISSFNPDWGCEDDSPFTCGASQLFGIAPIVNANNLLPWRIGVEAEARILHWRGPGNGLTESSYLVGPRFGLHRFKNGLLLSGKFGMGSATIDLPMYHLGNGTYFAYAPGFIAEFNLRPRLAVRTEYEYQRWPGFRGSATGTTTGCCGLTPNGFSLGLSYELLR